MKVYTYFCPSCPEGQSERIRVWERKIREQGNSPRILTRRIAEKNKLFKRLTEQNKARFVPVWMFALLEVGGGCMESADNKHSKAGLLRIIKVHATKPGRNSAR